MTNKKASAAEPAYAETFLIRFKNIIKMATRRQATEAELYDRSFAAGEFAAK